MIFLFISNTYTFYYLIYLHINQPDFDNKAFLKIYYVKTAKILPGYNIFACLRAP